VLRFRLQPNSESYGDRPPSNGAGYYYAVSAPFGFEAARKGDVNVPALMHSIYLRPKYV